MPPPQVNALLDQAIAHHRQGRLAQAAAGYAQVRRSDPRSFPANHLGGLVALQEGKPEIAIPLLQTASRLAPRHAINHLCLGTALLQLGQHDKARQSLVKTLELDPKQGEAWGNLGSLEIRAGRLAEAETAYKRALALSQKDPAAWSGLGAVKLLRGDPQEALRCQEQALALHPGHPGAGLGKAQALFQLNEPEEALQAFDAHLAKNPGDLAAASQRLLCLNYLPELSKETVAAAHRSFGQAAKPSKEPVFNTRVASTDSRLRVGFLSPDLRRHSVYYFLEPLLAHLDRSRFEVFLYHDHFAHDPETETLRGRAEHWRELCGLADPQAAQLIRGDGLDVLIDLCGHTGFNRMALLAERLAPTQVSYLGYPNTTGLEAMDYRLVDAITDPEGIDDGLYSETRVRFAPCAWSYRPPEASLPQRQSRSGPCFGSFNAANKLSRPTLACWARLLQKVPGSTLLVKSSGLVAAQFLAKAAAAGIPSDRLEVQGPLANLDEHLALYGRVDVALDPFPYAGTTTTCEALWMGTPVVTLCGDRHASRVGASLLTALGRPGWIAYSEDEYIEVAARVASSRPEPAETRRALQTSPLMDHPVQSKRFWDALLDCHQRRVGQPLARPTP